MCRLELYQGQPHAFFSRSRSKLYYGKTLAAMDAFLSELGYLEPGADFEATARVVLPLPEETVAIVGLIVFLFLGSWKSKAMLHSLSIF